MALVNNNEVEKVFGVLPEITIDILFFTNGLVNGKEDKSIGGYNSASGADFRAINFDQIFFVRIVKGIDGLIGQDIAVGQKQYFWATARATLMPPKKPI